MPKIKHKLLISCLLVLGLVPLAAANSQIPAARGASAAGAHHHPAARKKQLASAAHGSAKRKRQQQRLKRHGKTHSKDYMLGTASFYAEKFDGRTMANGQPLDMDVYTAAHPTLPLGSKIKATNLSNDRTIYVEITDRMPRSSGHVIDVTAAGAQALGFALRGLAKVELQWVSDQEFAAHQQLASHKNESK